MVVARAGRQSQDRCCSRERSKALQWVRVSLIHLRECVVHTNETKRDHVVDGRCLDRNETNKAENDVDGAQEERAVHAHLELPLHLESRYDEPR